MGTSITVSTDGLAKLAETVGGWLGWNARAEKKMADAKAYAQIKQAETDNTVMLMKLQGEEQLANYIHARESRKMNNVRQIVEKTKTLFDNDEKVSEEPVNQDWLNRFMSTAEDISDDEMQSLWAKILAGEIKRPKSFSLKTLDVLRNITKEEAELITKMAKFTIDNMYICTEDFAMPLPEQILMDEFGIICGEKLVCTYEVSPTIVRHISIGQQSVINLYSNEKIKVKLNLYQLTKVGKEILKLVSMENNDKFICNLGEHFKKQGIAKVTKITLIKNKTMYNQNDEVEI